MTLDEKLDMYLEEGSKGIVWRSGAEDGLWVIIADGTFEVGSKS